jgi:hypothetical protein
MGSRSKQGPQAVKLPTGCFVTCERCGLEQRGTFDDLVEFLDRHRLEHPDHELKVWIPAERFN